MATGLAVSVPAASPPLARASASAYPARRAACAITFASCSSATTFRSSPLRAATGLPGNRRGASVVRAAQDQDTSTIEGIYDRAGLLLTALVTVRVSICYYGVTITFGRELVARATDACIWVPFCVGTRSFFVA